MNHWFSNALATATPNVMRKVTPGRPMPLKNPSKDHSATPSGAPSMRGPQYASAMSSVGAAMPKGASSQWPASASNTKTGTVNSDPQSASQVAFDALP